MRDTCPIWQAIVRRYQRRRMRSLEATSARLKAQRADLLDRMKNTAKVSTPP